jgi:SPP1 family predicted phage head-tail adaptor
MNAGDLNKRVTIQRNTHVLNDAGEHIDTWVDVTTIWAGIQPLTGTRYFQSKQLNSDVSGVIRMR